MRRILLAIVPAVLLAAAGAVLPAHAQVSVVVPNRVIYPGETVTADALEEVPLRRALKNPQAVVLFPGQIAGKVARRTLLPGRMIAHGSVRDAWLVEPGRAVQVRFVHGALEIAVAGVPLQPGVAGDLIKVRNIDTGVVFTGTVMADGTIRVSAS